MAKVWKPKGKKTYMYRLTVNETGTKPYSKYGFKTEKEATISMVAKLHEFQRMLGQCKWDINKTLFSDCASKWLAHVNTSSKYELGTRSNYNGILNNHLLPYFKDYKIKNLSSVLINDWKDRKSKEVSPFVLNNCIKVLKAIFNYLIKIELLEVNPFAKLEKVTEPKRLHNRFSIAELKRIIAICKNEMPNYYCVFILSCLTGERIGEYLAFTVDDINVDLQKIFVTKQYTRRQLKARTKTEESCREKDIYPFIIEVIKWHRIRNNIFSGLLFPSKVKKGFPMSQEWVNSQFDKLLVKCGYPKDYMRVHDLRGQFVDICQALDLPLTYTSREVGHAKVKTTSDMYSAILKDTHDKAREKMQATFGAI